jgi:hypothetical protein
LSVHIILLEGVANNQENDDWEKDPRGRGIDTDYEVAHEDEN